MEAGSSLIEIFPLTIMGYQGSQETRAVNALSAYFGVVLRDGIIN